MNNPLVSVIIPTYNGARWLSDCVDSVLCQLYRPVEIIIVNDGSTDGTADVLRSFGPRIQVIDQDNAGIGAARNRGVARASGDYLAFLDHDDLWSSDKLQRHVAHAREHPHVDISYTDAEEFTEEGTVRGSFFDRFPGLRLPEQIFHEVIHFAVPLMSTVLLRTAFLRQQRLSFREAVSGVDDIGLFLEIAARGGRFSCQDKRLTRRRLHEHNLSKVHQHRFARRIVLYRDLLNQLSDATPEQRRELRWGLRHACWTVGECYWGNGDRREAQRLFAEAAGWDAIGLQAMLYGLAARLPAGLTRWMQRVKRLVQQRMMPRA